MIGRGKVDMILKYNVIGFDMDHTLVRYKLKKFAKLVYYSCSQYLINHKEYPKEVIPDDVKEFKTLRCLFFRAVYDHNNGNLLKLGSNNLITRGYNGLDLLTTKEIIETYGKNPLIPNYHILDSKDKNFTNLHEFYGAAIVPVLANIINLKKTCKYPVLNSKSPKDIMNDIMDAVEYNYSIKNLTKENITGYFFPDFVANTKKYINTISNDLLLTLEDLRKKDVKLFVASNSCYEIAEYIMRAAIGENWTDFFDFFIYDARKPGFFTDKEKPFLDINRNVIENFDEWMFKEKKGKEKILLNGNAELLNAHFKKHIKYNYKVLFFGDTIVSDCVYAFDKHRRYWDIVLILEELQELENGLQRRDYINYWKFWGSALFDKNIYSGWEQTNIFEFADNVAHRTFSRLDSPECVEFLKIK